MAFVDALPRSAQLEAAGFLHCPSYSATWAAESAREAFSTYFPILSFPMTSGIEDAALVKAAQTTSRGSFLFSMLSNLKWQKSAKAAW